MLKKTIIIAVLLLQTLQNYSQIQAISMEGRHVNLYTDHTWAYVDSTAVPSLLGDPLKRAPPNTDSTGRSGARPRQACEVMHTGSVAVVNASKSPIRFYYSSSSQLPKPDTLIVQPGSILTIPGVPVLKHADNTVYTWKAFFTQRPADEKQAGNSSDRQAAAFDSGEFVVTECGTYTIITGR